jgi:hypothetical protein
MLEQAQGTIHMLQEPRMIKTSLSTTSWSRRTSIGSASQLYTTDDDDASVSSYRKESHITSRQPPPISSPPPQFNTNRRTSYIQSPPLGPSHSSGVKPQQGLRMLFDSHGNRGGIGLSSLAKK